MKPIIIITMAAIVVVIGIAVSYIVFNYLITPKATSTQPSITSTATTSTLHLHIANNDYTALRYNNHYFTPVLAINGRRYGTSATLQLSKPP